MNRYKRLLALVTVFMILMLLSACRVGADRFELTHYIGKSVSTFERKSGTELTKQSSGVYLMQDILQVMVTDKDVTAITLLKKAGKYTAFGVKIGMTKDDADKLLVEPFGKEIAKTLDDGANTTTYSYLKDKKELYITYDNETKTAVEISYYLAKTTKDEDDTEASSSSGQLMVTVGDTRVYYNEAMVYLKMAQEKYEADYGTGIWKADILGNGATFGSMIKQEVVNQITELKIIRAEAGKQGITLSEEEISEAATYAKEDYEKLSSEEIAKYFITQELLQQVYADNLLANKMFETKTINIDTVVPDEDAKQITVQDIFIQSIDFDVQGNKLELTDEEKAAAYESIQNLKEKAQDTEDFNALAEANTEADTIEYTFGKGQGPKEYGETFEQAALALKTGQVSDIITTDTGWHLIYCVSDFNEDSTIQVKEDIIESRRDKMFSELYSEWSKDYDVVVNNEAWDSISYEE